MDLADQAYERIRKDILSCILSPGAQIAQSQLAEQYHTGLTPIREALQRLAHEKLVSPVPRSGYFVSPITYSDVRELFELRTILETSAVRLAVQRGSQEQLSAIRKIADFSYRYNDHEDYIRFLKLNTDFHCSIARLAGNQRLTDTLSKILDELTRVFHMGLDLKDSAEEMREEHLSLSQALIERDDDLAVKIIQTQVGRSAQRIMEAILSQVRKGLTGFVPGEESNIIDTWISGGISRET